jgi:hypothetical protein
MSVLLSGLFSLLSGRQKAKAQEKANAANVQQVNATNKANRLHQSMINMQNIAAQERINKRNVRNQNRINDKNIALARQTNAQAQKNFRTMRRDAQSVIQTTVTDAQAAGINPLTAIRGGATHGTVAAPSLISPQVQATLEQAARVDASMAMAPQVNPVFGMAEAIDNIGVTVFNALASQPDPEREMLEKALLREQLIESQKRNEAPFLQNFGYTIPTAENVTGNDYGNAETINGRGHADDDYSRVYGVDLEHSQQFEDAQEFEDRYGDVLGSAYGLLVAAADAGKYVKAKVGPMLRWPTPPQSRPSYSAQEYPRANYGFHNFERRAPGF